MHVNGDGYEQLNKAIEEKSYTTHLEMPETRQELKQIYIQKYGNSWSKHLSEDLAKITGRTARYEARNFNPSRIDRKLTGRKKAEVLSLGLQNAQEVKEPIDLAGKSSKVTFSGEVCYPSSGRGKKQEDCRDRDFTTDLNSKLTRDLLKGDFSAIFSGSYNMNAAAISEIDVYSISVDFV